MPNTNQTSMLSVKELNDILMELQSNKELPSINKIPHLGTFSEVDIVFVAGLFLQYMQHKDSWVKIPSFFNLTENENDYNHSHYFKQIEELYGVKHSDIFVNFKNAQNQNANSFSRFFVPPIYITNNSIKYFFGTQGANPRISKLKSSYTIKFNLLDFVNTQFKEYSSNEAAFKEYAAEIRRRLENAAPICVFTFVVTCKRLSQKEKRTLDQTKEYVEKIWHFTQTYVSGLYELAKNIVEHSGQGENDGQGIITIRAYSESETDKTKVLETHVIDYGTVGIIPKLKYYTENKAKAYNGELSEIQQKVKNAYTKDLDENLNENFEIADFIQGNILEQQKFRHIGHYGINKLCRLIQKPLEGTVYISSRGINGEPDFFNKDTENHTLNKGTHYFIKIPFIPANFDKLEGTVDTQHESATLGSSDALQKLMQKDVKTIKLNELNETNLDKFTGILDVAISEKIDKQFVDNVNIHFDQLSKCDKPFIVALNLENCFENNEESNLLRFLGYLTYEYRQTFIVYNLDFEVYKRMIDDNREFAQTRGWESFWHKERGMLVYTKTHKKDFYFADILYGKSPNDYYSVNKRLNHTFPNSASIVDNNMKDVQPNGSAYLPDFFDNNALLPFDILLKNQNKELALYNIETLLQNNLFHGELNTAIKDYTPAQLLENYADNFDGYHISNTHFKIGNKIHSSDFYYAKRLFQNSFYTTRLAMNLAKKITETNKNKTKPIALVGYEMYSELILSLTENYLTDIFSYKKVNHFVAQRKDDEFDFLPKDTFESYIKKYESGDAIIVVPIAATSSTSQKIEKEIRSRIYKQEREENKRSPEEAGQKSKNEELFKTRYNIILAQDDSDAFEHIRNNDKSQKTIIKLNAKWYHLNDCKLCYGAETQPLFDTDNSSLTPSLIFGKPEGLKKAPIGNEFENPIVQFDGLNFDDTIEYRTVARNDNYRIYDVDSDRFIEKNKENIKKWLKKVKDNLEQNKKIESTDNIIIVASCHESNSKFISLINKIVFSSAATIIYHQKGVDYKENFSLINKNYLSGENKKVFYVDDALITGFTFFEIYDLIQKTIPDNKLPLTASIILQDQAEPFVHNRAVQFSDNYFAFATYNQPPAHNILSANPLEYEHIRYVSLQESALHDTLKEHFYSKANKLSSKNPIAQKEETTNEKQIRRLKMFEATHKIYDYFATTKNDVLPDLKDDDERKKLIDFIYGQKVSVDEDTKNKALLKVLSQFPFVFYQDLRNKTFDWHKKLLSKLPKPNTDNFDIKKDYGSFQTFKFRLRRAAFLGNYQVLEKDFLEILLAWFQTNDKYFEKRKKQKTSNPVNNPEAGRNLLSDLAEVENRELKSKEDNLQGFPVFVLGNYTEMIQKNSWVAYHILKAVKKVNFKQSKQGRQFYNMLQIEATIVIDEFTKMINRDYDLDWQKLYKDIALDKLYNETDRIVEFFNKKIAELNKTNKYSVVKETFLTDDWIKKNNPFVNYLWIKQLLYSDSIAKDPKIKISFQKEIDEIISKMKGFFPDKEKTQAFFIVTDGQQKPYVLWQEDSPILNDFTDKLKADTFKSLIDFLKGKTCNTGNTTETTAEFIFDKDEKQWKNIYTNEVIKLDFLPQNTEWLYLIRISKLKDGKNGNCIFETQGLLGFYSQNTMEQYLPKQLLMLLRKDISAFINKHHKNDEFSELIQQKEKNKYVFRLNHGVSTYEDAIESILENCNDVNLKDDLETFYEYLITKLDIIDKLSSKTPPKEVSLQTIKDEFENKYEKVLSLNVASINGIAKNDIQALVKLNNFTGFSNLDEKYYFPENSIKDIVFELLNNIRKNVCNANKWQITADNPLRINVTVINEGGNKYLSVTNNHVRDLDPQHSKKEDVPHGLDLLRQMWSTHKLGKIITPDYPLKEYSFTIKIQLKKYEEDNNH